MSSKCSGVMLMMITMIVLIGLLGIVECQQKPTNKVRGAWIPTFEFCTTDAQCNNTMYTLKQQGVNRVYISVWDRGQTYFLSVTMRNFVGQSGLGPDILSYSVKYARQYGLEIFAWFEYGLMAAMGSVNNDFARKAQSLGWIAGVADNFVWMYPTKVDAVNFVCDIMIDALQAYDLDGVQLDDHFAWPAALPGSYPEAVTNAMQTVHRRIHAVTDLPISFSPATIDFALSKYNVDWVLWSYIGLFEECAPQIYRQSFSSFKYDLDDTLRRTPPSLHQYLIAGVLTNDGSYTIPWAEVEKMLDYTAAKGLGVSVWYSRGIIQSYPAQFRDYWN